MLLSITTIAIFVIAYILFIIFPHKRTIMSIIAAFVITVLLLISRVVSLQEIFFTINWNVMGIFVGTMAVADIFMESRVPAYIAEKIVDKTKTTAWAMLAICILTGVISAFVENVATVLIVAPIALALSKKLQINPMSLMIGIAISSNLQGTATLIGDPPSMLLGGFAKMNFMDFFFYHGKPSIFFAVQIGAVFSFAFLYFIFKKHNKKIVLIPIEKVQSWLPTVFLVLLIIILALSSFFDTGFSYAAGIICMIFGIISVVWKIIFMKGQLWKTVKSFDWDTTFFLIAIFILVGSLTMTGWIEKISEFLTFIVGGNLFFAFVLIVFLSVVLSAFIDNVPYLATMLPVALIMANKLGTEPSLLLFGLLIGASLGGNVTPIGASANVVACGILKKEGIHVRFGEFVKIGLPFTLIATIPASLFIWLVWGVKW